MLHRLILILLESFSLTFPFPSNRNIREYLYIKIECAVDSYLSKIVELCIWKIIKKHV